MSRWLIPLCVLLVLGGASICNADQVSEGRTLYMRNCAACHGIKADGNGPAAPALTTKAPDLRFLSARYGNPLPQDQIARALSTGALTSWPMDRETCRYGARRCGNIPRARGTNIKSPLGSRS